MSLMMNEAVSTMLNPYDSHHIPSHLYEHPHHHQQVPKRYLNPYKQNKPRVVKDQKATFETDELFKKLARESEHIIYTPAYMQKSRDDNKKTNIDDKLRQQFLSQYKEGTTEIVFTSTGIVLQLHFTPNCRSTNIDNKVTIHSNHMILNGVCVRWRGTIDLQTLTGVGCIEFDEENAREEDAVLIRHEEYMKQIQMQYMNHSKRDLPFKNFAPPGPANIKVE